MRKGQLLAIIEPGTPAASLQEAQSNVAQADAAIKQAGAKVLSAIAAQRQAEAYALAPQANAARAQRDYDRYLDLRRRDPLAAAPTQVDQARAQAESSAAQVAARSTPPMFPILDWGRRDAAPQSDGTLRRNTLALYKALGGG